MKNILFTYILLSLTILGMAQARTLPSNSFDMASQFSQSELTTRAWDYELSFEDSLLPSNIILENLDSLQDHPDVAFITGLDFYNDVWLMLQFTGESNSWMGSNSYFNPPGQADRWMIIPNIPISSNAVLRWQARSISFSAGPSNSESYEILVASGSATSSLDFTNGAIETIAAEATEWTTREVDMSAWAGDTVSIAFRHTSNNQKVLGIDNIQVGQAPVPQGEVTGTFENADDFSLDLTPWTTYDLDTSLTYGISGISYPNKNTRMSFMAFNPASTIPALTTAPPHVDGGEKYGACFSAVNGPNNDWLVSPQVIISEGGKIKFIAKSFSANYALERFRVLVSTESSDPADFSHEISATPYQIVDTAWTMFEYDLSSWANDSVYVGINCVSDDAYIFLIDNIVIDTTGHIGISETELKDIQLFPNPASNFINLENVRGKTIQIFNAEGRLIAKEESEFENWKMDVSSFTTGIYFLRLIGRDEIQSFPFMVTH